MKHPERDHEEQRGCCAEEILREEELGFRIAFYAVWGFVIAESSSGFNLVHETSPVDLL